MKKLFLFLGVLFVFAVATSFAEDSDLVKVAKQEKERRAKTQAKKTLTNQDIDEIRKKQPITGIENTGEQTQPAEGADAAAKNGTKEKKVADTNTEEYWKGRKQEVDRELKDAQSKVEQLQTEVNQLQTAFYAESDGVGQRPVIKQEWDERLKALDQAKQDLKDAQQQSDGLEDEARKAGALPGWVRD